MTATLPFSIDIMESGHRNFALVVSFNGQKFNCGSYISRAEAQKAGTLFVQRKQGEAEGQKKRPRLKR
jgi:hypothetical protein